MKPAFSLGGGGGGQRVEDGRFLYLRGKGRRGWENEQRSCLFLQGGGDGEGMGRRANRKVGAEDGCFSWIVRGGVGKGGATRAAFRGMPGRGWGRERRECRGNRGLTARDSFYSHRGRWPFLIHSAAGEAVTVQSDNLIRPPNQCFLRWPSQSLKPTYFLLSIPALDCIPSCFMTPFLNQPCNPASAFQDPIFIGMEWVSWNKRIFRLPTPPFHRSQVPLSLVKDFHSLTKHGQFHSQKHCVKFSFQEALAMEKEANEVKQPTKCGSHTPRVKRSRKSIALKQAPPAILSKCFSIGRQQWLQWNVRRGSGAIRLAACTFYTTLSQAHTHLHTHAHTLTPWGLDWSWNLSLLARHRKVENTITTKKTFKSIHQKHPNVVLVLFKKKFRRKFSCAPIRQHPFKNVAFWSINAWPIRCTWVLRRFSRFEKALILIFCSQQLRSEVHTGENPAKIYTHANNQKIGIPSASSFQSLSISVSFFLSFSLSSLSLSFLIFCHTQLRLPDLGKDWKRSAQCWRIQ